MRRLAAVVVAGIFTISIVSAAARAAGMMLDVVPAPGGAPVRLRIAQTASSPAGPQTTQTVVELRRTGPATVALQRNTDIVPLVVSPDGTLRLDPTVAPAGDDVRALIAVIDMAHGVTGVTGAGDRAGWTAIVPLAPASPAAALPPPSPAPAASPSPAAPLVLPVHTFGASVAGTFDLDGSTQTTLAAPSSGAPRSQRSRGGGGGFGGGIGGFGRGGGFGGGRGGGGGEDGPRGAASPPVTLDFHVAGHVAHGSLANLTITQTRSVIINGLTYSNVAASTIDVLK